MEVILALGIFGFGMFIMAIGVMIKGRELRGSCGGPKLVLADGQSLSCDACPRKKKALCPSGNEFVKLAQLGHPDPDHHR